MTIEPPPLVELSTRHAWCIIRAGSLDRLTRQREPLAATRPGEARIRVGAVGLNFADIFACLGLYSATPAGRFVPGFEVAGIVEALAPADGGATSPRPPADIRVGDRVMGLTRFGGYASVLNLDLRCVRRLPDHWSLAEGAAFPVQALTAWYGLVALGRAGAGDTVLVHSAAGGVGLQALAFARTLGADVLATVGRAAKRDWLAATHGLAREAIIVRDRRRFDAQLDDALHATGREGLDVVLDAVLGPFFMPGWRRLRPEGRYVAYGAADFMTGGTRPAWPRIAWRWLRRARLDPLQTIAENRTLSGFNLIWLWDRVDRLGPALDAALALTRRPPHIGARFAFADAPAAMRALQSGTTIGKVVLEM